MFWIITALSTFFCYKLAERNNRNKIYSSAMGLIFGLIGLAFVFWLDLEENKKIFQ